VRPSQKLEARSVGLAGESRTTGTTRLTTSSVLRELAAGALQTTTHRQDVHEIRRAAERAESVTRQCWLQPEAVARTPRVSVERDCARFSGAARALVGHAVRNGHTREPRSPTNLGDLVRSSRQIVKNLAVNACGRDCQMVDGSPSRGCCRGTSTRRCPHAPPMTADDTLSCGRGHRTTE